MDGCLGVMRGEVGIAMIMWDNLYNHFVDDLLYIYSDIDAFQPSQEVQLLKWVGKVYQ